MCSHERENVPAYTSGFHACYGWDDANICFEERHGPPEATRRLRSRSFFNLVRTGLTDGKEQGPTDSAYYSATQWGARRAQGTENAVVFPNTRIRPGVHTYAEILPWSTIPMLA